MNGQAIKQDIYILQETVSPQTGAQTLQQTGCGDFLLPALAENEFTSDLKNDKHAVIWFFDETFTDAQIFLQKRTAGVWADVIEITDDTLGTFYDFGFFVNKFTESAIGFLCDWALVLAEYEAGVYRFKVDATKSIGTFDPQYSFEFNLKVYTSDRADRTTRIEWNRSGVLGNRLDDQKIDDYGVLNWYNQLRIPKSILMPPSNEPTVDTVRYPNGEEKLIGNSAEEEYTWNIYQLPWYIHNFIKIDVLQSGPITFNDYNKLAPMPMVDKILLRTGAYSPEFIVGSQNSNVSVSLKPYYNNLTHLYE